MMTMAILMPLLAIVNLGGLLVLIVVMAWPDRKCGTTPATSDGADKSDKSDKKNIPQSTVMSTAKPRGVTERRGLPQKYPEPAQRVSGLVAREGNFWGNA